MTYTKGMKGVGTLLLAYLSFSIVGASCTKAPDPSRGLKKPQQAPAQAPQVPLVQLVPPTSWSEKPLTMSFYLKMWDLPEGGAANLSWLGNQPDIIQANLDRWYGQWKVADGNPQDAAVVEPLLNPAGQPTHFPTTLATLKGTLVSTSSVGGGEPREGWMLAVAVSETPQGPLYFKVMAPEKVVETSLNEFKAMLLNLDVK